MIMEDNKLAKRSDVSFVTHSLQTLDGAKEWAKEYLNSKLAPAHFYEKTGDGKPDYSRGNVGAIVAVIAHGHDVGMSATQSIQQIVPINGLTSIKGDGAKALIMASGLCKSWQEKITGTMSGGDYLITITSARKDPNEEMSRSFGIGQAKRAGLWIEKADVTNKAKLQYSPWYRYPDRMLKYRALGFLARDLYPDVMSGMVTQEEAMDYPDDVTVIDTPSGGKIHADTGGASEDKSEALTSRVADKINERNDTIPEAEVLQEQVQDSRIWNEEELKVMGPKILDLIENDYPEILDRLNALPGKRTNKKFRLGILAYQMGRFDEFIQQSSDINGPVEGESEQQPQTDDTQPPQEQVNQPYDPEPVYAGVPFEITELPEGGARPFDEVKGLFHNLEDIGLTEDVYSKLVETMADDQGEALIFMYPDKQSMCRSAKGSIIANLYNAFNSVN